MMPQQPERVDVEMIAFMVDDRPHVFINDIEAIDDSLMPSIAIIGRTSHEHTLEA